MGLPALDYGNPLFTFDFTDASKKTYTATKDCYLYGTITGMTAGTYATNELYINDILVTSAKSYDSGGWKSDNVTVFLKLSKGDAVRIASNSKNAVMHVFAER